MESASLANGNRVLTSAVHRHRIAGVTVLYRPPADFLSHLKSYVADLTHLYVVDNSEDPDPELQRELARYHCVEYLPMDENVGIAGALNLGIRRAAAGGFEWVLTMDQDSRAKRDMVREMLRCRETALDDRVAIVAPVHRGRYATIVRGNEPFELVNWTMTSGSLVQVSVCKKLGMFREDLFIDGVDHEYCLRLRRHGYRILRANRALLDHESGHVTKRLLGNFVTTNHEPERRYYMIRNRFAIRRIYAQSVLLCATVSLLEALVVAIYEDRKLTKLRMMLRGLLDSRRNRLGPLLS